MLLYSKNQHNTVKQLYSNLKKNHVSLLVWDKYFQTFDFFTLKKKRQWEDLKAKKPFLGVQGREEL